MGKYKYNYVRDLPDFRDYSFKISEPITIPEKVDLREKYPAICDQIYDQGQLGSCTANSGAEAVKFLEVMNNINPIEDVSRLFLYYVTRSIEGTTRWDSGCSIRDTAKALARYGICNENLWSYDIRKFTRKPPVTAYNDATKHRSIEYYRVNGIQKIKECLVSGFPLMFGFSVYSSFESPEVERTGIVPMPKKNDSFLGGHAVLLLGFDDKMLGTNGDTGYFICQNSWGKNFGDQGFFYLPYAYLPMMSDFWTIRKVSGY